MDTWNGTISLLVACIELILLVNLIVLADKTRVNKLVIVTIALLCIYQLLEFLMCHFGLAYPFLAYLAFADISFLPPLSLYMALHFLEHPFAVKSKIVFFPAIFFIAYYAFVIEHFEVVSCTVLYASYNYPLGTLYGAFYYLPIAAAMFLLALQIKKEKEGKKSFLSKVLLTGYVIISIPVITAFLLSAFESYSLLIIIESIMCKFAVVLALCLGFIALYEKTSHRSK